MRGLWASFVLIVGVTVCVSIAGLGEESIILYGRIIDGTGAPPIEQGAVAILGDRIEAAGPRADVAVPERALIIDLGTATILPGFIDTHVHKAYSAKYLRRWAQSGVTTVRDLGGNVDLDWDDLRDEFAGDPELASLVISGPLLSVPDGYAMNHPLNCGVAITSTNHAESVVRSLVQEDVDCIKIAIESVYMEGATQVMPLEIAETVVEAARKYRMPVVAHVLDALDLAVAIEAGVDQMAHMIVGAVPREMIQTMVDRGTLWVTTINTRTSANLKQFVASGGVAALGTDDGAVRFPEAVLPVDELEKMHRSGLDVMSIIVAATHNAALACGIERMTGTLEVGKLADILVVAGDPLGGLEALAAPLLVMHRGVIIRDERATGTPADD